MGVFASIWNPEFFQGSLRRRGYFEGWYFRLTGADAEASAAVIPGIALGRRDSPDSHAFVQFISGGRAEYFTYPLREFEAGRNAFFVRVGKNEFSRGGVSLDLRSENAEIKGTLRFSDPVPFPKTVFRPGVMGPFGYLPGLECYHGVASIRHNITGSLIVDGRRICFDGGAGYTEKDWGRSFPRAWLWAQANFPSGATLLFSAADIPFLGGYFLGFFAFLQDGGGLRLFATYSGARIVRLEESGGATIAEVRGRNGSLELTARPGPGGYLKAPKNGVMDGLIEESLRSVVSVRLADGYGNTIFEDQCSSAGMERYAFESLVRRAARH